MKQNYFKSLLLVLMMCLGASAWAQSQLYTCDFTTVDECSYTKNVSFTLAKKGWKASIAQVASKVFYLGCNSNNAASGVLANNDDFSDIYNAVKNEDNKVTSTTHEYALLFDNAYNNVGTVNFSWAGGNNTFMVYLFGYTNSSWQLLSTTEYATSGSAVAGEVKWESTEGGVNFSKFAVVARPGTPTSTGTNKTLRAKSFTITSAPSNEKYTVSFNAGANGSCSTGSLTETSANAGVTLPNVSANTGWVFKGWSTSTTPTSANAGVAGDTYKPSANETLYAYYVPAYTLTITQPAAGGTLTVSDAKGALANGAIVEVGTNLTCEVTNIPEGKRFSRFYVTYDGGESKYKGTNPATFDNIPTSGITAADVTVTYMDVPKYTVTYKVFGNTVGTEDVYENNSIANAPTPSLYGWTLTGWTTNDSYVSSETAPSIFNSPITSDVDLHAVFSQSTGNGPGIATLTNKEICDNLSNSYTTSSITNSYGTWNYNAAKQGNYSSDGEYFMQLRNNATTVSYLQIPEVSGNITSIVLGRVCNTSKAKYTGSIYFRETAGNDATNIATATQATALTDVTLEIPAGYSTGYVMVSGACRIESVTVNYVDGVTTYTITDPRPTTTITIASACTDGKKCYSTYSNESAWVVADDIEVSEISIVDGQLYVESYNTGDIVPANTGVMVSASEGGNYEVVLSNEEGTSVLGNDNFLHPSSEAMTGNNLFYRLTMHNGTQIGFAWGAADGAAFSLAANKAYLAVPSGAGVKSLMWFGETETAIQGVEAENNNKVIYDLQGRRVNKAQKGLYIVNGKKVLF